MNARKRLTAALAGVVATLVCLSAIELKAQDPKTKKPAAGPSAYPAPAAGAAAGTAPAAAYWQHVRLDEPELKELGKGSVEAGMNKLGDAGCTLMLVTSQIETGTAGFHYFKRPPWNKPTPRPQYEFKRIAVHDIMELGQGKFAPGMQAVEREGWELVAVTTAKNGAVGFHYFMRPKQAAAKTP
jgi:hypothetical protein